MRRSHHGLELGQVHPNRLLIHGVRIRLCRREGAVHPTLQIFQRNRIHRKNGVLGTGLNGHVADGKPVVNGNIRNGIAGELDTHIAGAIYANHADQR